MFYKYLDYNLYYETIGEGKPMVILHGFGGNGGFMKACMEPIFNTQDKYQRIYIDMPGMGKSDFDLEYASANKILEVLLSFIKEHVTEPFLLVGQSYGGYIARGLLAHVSDCIDGLFLLCPVIVPIHKNRIVPTNYPMFLDEVYLNQLSLEQRTMFLEYGILGNEQTYARYKQAVSLSMQETNQEFLDLLEKNYAFLHEVDAIIHSHPFNKQTLFLCGRQDYCVGYQDLWKILEDYPRATFSILDVAGHNLQIEQVELFEQLVKEWLGRVEKY